MQEIFGEFGSLWQRLENKEDNWNKIELKTESIRKLSNFYFQWTKTLYQNNFNHSAFFFTLFEGHKCHKLYEITPKKRFSWESKQTNIKSFKFHKMKSYAWRFYLCFLNSLKFEIYFFGLPWEPFLGSYFIWLTAFIALEKCKKRMQYGLKYSATRFLSTENDSISW